MSDSQKYARFAIYICEDKVNLNKNKNGLSTTTFISLFFLMNIVSFFMVNTKTKIRINVILKVSHESILQQTFMRHCISFISKKKMYLAISVKGKQRILT